MASEATAKPAADRHARRKARTRGALVSAARHLFATQGFEATTVGQIADAADTAHGSFYNHFSTKDEVLAAVFEDTLSDQFRLLKGRHEGVEDPAERVSIAHRHLLAAVRADPDWGWLILRLDVPHRVIEEVVGADATNDLRAGIQTGRFVVADPTVALHASGGALIGVIHLILRDGLGHEADTAHVEGVLRSFGLEPQEASAIARRPLPESPAGSLAIGSGT